MNYYNNNNQYKQPYRVNNPLAQGLPSATLSYNTNAPQFYQAPVDDMVNYLQVNNERYYKNKYDLASLKALNAKDKIIAVNDKDRLIKQAALDKINNQINELEQSGDYSRARSKVIDSTKDYLSNTALLKAKENYKTRETAIANILNRKNLTQQEKDYLIKYSDTNYQGVQLYPNSDIAYGDYSAADISDMPNGTEFIHKYLPDIKFDSNGYATMDTPTTGESARLQQLITKKYGTNKHIKKTKIQEAIKELVLQDKQFNDAYNTRNAIGIQGYTPQDLKLYAEELGKTAGNVGYYNRTTHGKESSFNPYWLKEQEAKRKQAIVNTLLKGGTGTQSGNIIINNQRGATQAEIQTTLDNNEKAIKDMDKALEEMGFSSGKEDMRTSMINLNNSLRNVPDDQTVTINGNTYSAKELKRMSKTYLNNRIKYDAIKSSTEGIFNTAKLKAWGTTDENQIKNKILHDVTFANKLNDYNNKLNENLTVEDAYDILANLKANNKLHGSAYNKDELAAELSAITGLSTNIAKKLIVLNKIALIKDILNGKTTINNELINLQNDKIKSAINYIKTTLLIKELKGSKSMNNMLNEQNNVNDALKLSQEYKDRYTLSTNEVTGLSDIAGLNKEDVALIKSQEDNLASTLTDYRGDAYIEQNEITRNGIDDKYINNDGTFNYAQFKQDNPHAEIIKAKNVKATKEYMPDGERGFLVEIKKNNTDDETNVIRAIIPGSNIENPLTEVATPDEKVAKYLTKLKFNSGATPVEADMLNTQDYKAVYNPSTNQVYFYDKDSYNNITSHKKPILKLSASDKQLTSLFNN